ELNELFKDLLDIGSSNIRKGFSLNLNDKVNINHIIKRSIKLNQNFANNRNIKITTKIADKIADDNFVINLDGKRTKQILTNLISNAIKYSNENTEVKIIADEIENKDNQKFLQIKVVDQGFGMTPNQIKLAFEKYQTIKNPNSNKVDSFGLGLPIVKELVRAQNGKIEVNSKPNYGTEVIITFPNLNQNQN
ncbi:MAG: HAMP domain-containing sensor histidine kinase, partial [Rickettsiales bacterium]|nr:HAMP domain-containing sensor histidine kinase [Rickettsiales bacterium]